MLQSRHDKDNRSPEVRFVIICLLAVSWVTVLARCWVRIRLIKAFAMDDWLTIFTLHLFTSYSALVLVGAHWGIGRRHRDLTEKQRMNAMHAWYFGELSYILAATVLRFAVGASLLRVATKKLHRKIVYACFTINFLFNAYFFFFTIFQCTPVDGFWRRVGGMKGVVCHPHIAVDSTYVSSAVAACIDWIFGIMPFRIIADLQINQKKKIALGAIMGLGAVASVAPIVRIPYTMSLVRSDDFLWSTVDVIIWSSVEPGIGLIAISLAALRPLFASIVPAFSTSRGTVDKSGSKHYGSKHHGSKHDGDPNNIQTVPITHAQRRSTTPWEDEEGRDIQLHSLSQPIGHFVSIKGGVDNKGPGKSQKILRTSGSSSESAQKSLSAGDSEEVFLGDNHVIFMKQDFKHYSGTGSDSFIFYSQ